MNRRTFLRQASCASLAAVAPAIASEKGYTTPDLANEILGQGTFRYRANRSWGRLDHEQHPVKDCHAITKDRAGRILLLTNETRNNLIAYSLGGEFVASWEHRFPGAHALELRDEKGDELCWITDHNISVVSLCTPEGREIRRLEPSVFSAKYPDPSKYHPTNVAVMPDGDFYISDGYGSSFVHHVDPEWKYISSFGGIGTEPANLRTPHAVWIDNRSGKSFLLVCDRSNAMLKWFSPAGELIRIVPLPGAKPSNVVQLGQHLAITSLNGMVLILDGADRVVSVVGGDPANYVEGQLQPLQPFNYSLFHPHGLHIEPNGDIYLAQWDSNRTYPLKLERLPVVA